MLLAIIIGIIIIALLVALRKETPDIIGPIIEPDEKIADSVILDINYQKTSGTNWCLPACLSMLLDYYGVKKYQSEIAKEIMKEDGSGSNIQKAIRFVNGLGFDMAFNVLPIVNIPDYIHSDIPIIAVMEYKLSNPACHARLVKGYDLPKEILISDDPSIRKDYELTFERFKELSLVGSNRNYVHVLIMTRKE